METIEGVDIKEEYFVYNETEETKTEYNFLKHFNIPLRNCEVKS